MKNKKLPLLFAFLSGGFLALNAQIGINTDNPQSTLEIVSSNSTDPNPTEGLIVPRVTSLNTTDAKEKGLLVFLDYEDPSTPEIEKGFYWWNGTNWIPFFSMNKMQKNTTVTYVNFLSEFLESTSITSNTSTNTRNMVMDPDTLIANDSENFEIDSSGKLVVLKKGTYHLLAVVSLNSYTETGARDAFEIKILVNGAEPSPVLRSAYGFPSGSNSYNSNSSIVGYVKLEQDDVVSVQINRYYRDTGTSVTITPNGNLSSLTLTYLGDF
jgi:hypothetical protein